ALATVQTSAAARPAFPRGAVVRTILRDVPVESITGVTLIHEHLSMGSSGSNPALTFYQDLDLMAAVGKACANDGVSCIVGTGWLELGRSIDSLRTIATKSGMLIVASGGLHGKDGYPADTLRKSEEQIADDFDTLATKERWGAIGEMGTGTDVPM